MRDQVECAVRDGLMQDFSPVEPRLRVLFEPSTVRVVEPCLRAGDDKLLFRGQFHDSLRQLLFVHTAALIVPPAAFTRAAMVSTLSKDSRLSEPMSSVIPNSSSRSAMMLTTFTDVMPRSRSFVQASSVGGAAWVYRCSTEPILSYISVPF